MPIESAGLLLFRRRSSECEFLLVHPGGPFWAKRDEGSWSIPKGEYRGGEDPADAALREFAEELGASPPAGALLDLGTTVQRGGKRVRAFGREADFEPGIIRSNEVEVVWPPRSGRRIRVPEIDRAAWFPFGTAQLKILDRQAVFLDRVLLAIAGREPSPSRGGSETAA